MPISGFPINDINNSNNNNINAVTSIVKNTDGSVVISRNNNQSEQSFQIETAINDIELDNNGNVNANLTNNQGQMLLFTMPDTLEDISITNHKITLYKNFNGQSELDLPKEILEWTPLSIIKSDVYYSFDDHVWKCILNHTSTSNFDYNYFTLIGNGYITTISNNYEIPNLKEGVHIDVKINANYLTSIDISCNNLKPSQKLTIQYLSGNASGIKVNILHDTVSVSGNANAISPNITKIYGDIRNIIHVKNVGYISVFYDGVGRNTTLFSVAGSSGVASWRTGSTVYPGTNAYYNIYTSPYGDIAFNAIPVTNTYSGTASYINRTGIVAGQNNNGSSGINSAIVAGNGNSVSGNGRVVLTGFGGTSSQNTNLSYREISHFDSVDGYSSSSDISLLTKKMTDVNFNYLTSNSSTLKKTLGIISGRISIGIHHITLIGQSNTDFFIRKFTIVYSNSAGTFNLIDNSIEYSYNTSGASSWDYTVNDVADDILKIIPSGGDYWVARINSIYNNR